MAKLTPDDVKYLVVHCSATQAKADIGVKEIGKWHRERGFLKIGYHFVIRRNGTLEIGRPIDEVGAHVRNYNHCSVGVCMVGGVNAKLQPEDNFTLDQYATLGKLMHDLQHLFRDVEVLGHRDFPKVTKACPCFDVRTWAHETGVV